MRVEESDHVLPRRAGRPVGLEKLLGADEVTPLPLVRPGVVERQHARHAARVPLGTADQHAAPLLGVGLQQVRMHRPRLRLAHAHHVPSSDAHSGSDR